jgi:16S rRNA (guanine527-N7)-methyltransferase
MTLAEQLQAGLSELGATLDESVQERLLAYVDLLAKWNKVHNLTAVRDPAQMVSQHLLDSLVVLPLIDARSRVLDVGSGGGLPGIPIAIARPDLAVTLLDSNHKKAAFLRQAKSELGLDNVDVVCERVEQWRPVTGFDVVVSRAFADLAEFAQLSAHLVAPSGALIAMKGLYPFEEIARLPEYFRVDEVRPLKVPQLAAERHVVVLRKTA